MFYLIKQDVIEQNKNTIELVTWIIKYTAHIYVNTFCHFKL